MNIQRLSFITHHFFILPIIIFTLFTTSCYDSLAPGYHRFFMEHDGLKRNYWVYIPEGYDENQPTPVVFDMHPVFTSASIQQLITGMSQKADEENFILVQPNGSSVKFGLFGSWNGGPGCCPPAYDPDKPVDDVGFILSILDEIKDTFNVDGNRIYADGISNGGYLSHRLACEASGIFAAIGPVVSNIGYADIEECQPDRPVPVWMFSGSEDSIDRRVETAEYWAYNINGCNSEISPVEVWANGSVSCYQYQGCNAPVEHCIGDGVGHCWPSPATNILPCTDDMNTADHIWQFFEENPL